MTKSYSVYFFGKLYDRMTEDLHLAGMSEHTHAGYLRAVRQLADYCKTPPAKISEDQRRSTQAILALKKADGFKSYKTVEIALYHQLGKLPEPNQTHRFC